MFEVKNPYSSEALKVIFPNLYKQTLKLFADPTDRTRELAVTLITKYETFVLFCCNIMLFSSQCYFF